MRPACRQGRRREDSEEESEGSAVRASGGRLG